MIRVVLPGTVITFVAITKLFPVVAVALLLLGITSRLTFFKSIIVAMWQGGIKGLEMKDLKEFLNFFLLEYNYYRTVRYGLV